MTLAEAHARIRTDATRLAGRPEDLVQRASAYWHLYRHSRGNHGFPLLAAHGALWGAGHFRRGLRLARLLSRLSRRPAEERDTRLAMVEAFALAFKEINRRVCVETYTAYHLTRIHAADPDLDAHIPGTLIEALARCHHANDRGQRLSRDDRRALFDAFFLWEQDTIVGPAVESAVAKFNWPLMRAVSLRPPVGFAYFRRAEWLWFRAFHDKDERIARGQQAYALAERYGWTHVEESLSRYGELPREVLNNPDQCFQGLLDRWNVGAYALG